MRPEPQRGILPSAETQIAINLALADMSRRFAESQARRGVDPRIAARQGTDSAAALLAWMFFVAPVMGLFTLVGLSSLRGMLLVAPINAIGTLLLIRIHTAIVRPADRKPVYAIPTWAVAVAGPTYIAAMLSVLILDSLMS